MTLFNKTPKWDASHGGHVLNFQGRVTESSVKNFQLCSHETGDDVVLQFGRVGKHKFNMDVCYPLSPFQAFAICVSCMDGKLADRQGYEMLKRLTGFGQSPSLQLQSKDCNAADNDSNNDMQAPDRIKARGLAAGTKTITGQLMESLPSQKYLKDTFTRSFGRGSG